MTKRMLYALYILGLIAKWVADDTDLKEEIGSLVSNIRYNTDLSDEVGK